MLLCMIMPSPATPSSLAFIESRIESAMRGDRHALRREFRAIQADVEGGRPFEKRLEQFFRRLDESAAFREYRKKSLPAVRFDEELPVSARRQEIARTIDENQVVIVSGETGSGKSTQLPKICLEIGRGIDGLIGHTQPRRIAARSIAARIAEELGTPLGFTVGFKVRFAESLSKQTHVKLMTDGILLAETQSDPFFDRYDTLILDEAHERSLNIDFLIGYLKRLLPKRPDLKVVITSATIDAQRFAAHFGTPEKPAPVIEVSGRTYPVEIVYRPMLPDEEGDEPDLQQAVYRAMEELPSHERGDVLIFMPTERDIHETAKTFRSRPLPGDPTGRDTEILPLYARLSMADQQRVFHPGGKRRIVIATNVAESSLTVPRIRYVIDPGTARVSRYSPRSKTQRLPIEAVSRASADQRAGRCGRIGPGVCVRLFSEEDFAARDRFTAPEIQRTNLAAVILQTTALRLGEIEDFPFLDPPKTDAVRDGYRTLFELGAIDENRELTEIGRKLSRLPVDPRIGRMILAADEEHCLHEMLIVAAALEIQDPRERPLEKQEAADEAHAQFLDADSDYLSYLKLWEFYHHLKETLSRNQLQKACKQNFLSYNRMREWADIHRELLELVEEADFYKKGKAGTKSGAVTGAMPTLAVGRKGATRTSRQHAHDKRGHGTENSTYSTDKYAAIHRAILTGLLSNLAQKGETYEYTVAGGGKGNLWPGSGVFQGRPKWIVAAEVVETTRRYLRCCAKIDPRWIEPLAGHLAKKTHRDPQWDPAAASAMAIERVTLFGLTIVPGRRVRLGPIDPQTARELLIRHGLVEGQFEKKPDFLVHNERLFEEMERLQAKLRRRDLLLGEWARYEFYDRRIPDDVYDGPRLMKWLRDIQSAGAAPTLAVGMKETAENLPQHAHDERGHGALENLKSLCMTQADLIRGEVEVVEGAYPDTLSARHIDLPLDYRFSPGERDDGVTVSVPLEALNQLDPSRLDWLVPGLLEEKVLASIRALPKSLRTLFVPAPESAKNALPLIRFGVGDFRGAVAAALSRLAGQHIPPNAFQDERLPDELKMNVRVTGAEGETLAVGRDLDELRKTLGAEAAATFSAAEDPRFNRDGVTAWDFGELPAEIEVARGFMTLKAYPALVDREDSASLKLFDSPERAAREMRAGSRRLFILASWRELKTQIDWLPRLNQILVYGASLEGLDLRRQFAELLADRAFFAEESALPRNESDFKKQLAAGKARLGLAVQAIAEWAMPTFENFHRAVLALESMKNPNAKYAVADIREQFGQLLGPKFATAAPWEWLKQYPRYFRAACARLESLTAGGLARDQKNFAEFQPRWEAYRAREEERAALGLFDSEWEYYRWMLEEFRVSLYAQKLGTAVPVSGKRLDAQWEKIRGS
ncbi:MAG: ATP-dependent RNA helicase HrpA [Pirellulales bacterium]|nr:ATP-dependent RNA helicase HrpA [Pirellulales bacterium]